MKCAARSSLKLQDAKITQKNRHLGTIAQLVGLYIRNRN